MNTAQSSNQTSDPNSGAPRSTSIEIIAQKKFMNRVIQKRHSKADRRHKRYAVISIGEMSIVNREISLDGIVTEVSLRGLKFRPASVYLMDRTGHQVSVSFENFQLVGRIRASRDDGYGIELLEEFDHEQYTQFLRDQQVMTDEHLAEAS